MNPLGPYHILLVENDPAGATFAENLLRQWNLTVSIAQNSNEAIELTKANNYDLILMDVQMPAVNGYETTRLIRRLEEKYHGVPIIAHANVPPAVGEKQADEQGLNGYLQKPFDQTQLYDMLQKQLHKDQPGKLKANLDKCTDGDVEFRRELAQLLANNISELLTNIEKALKLNDPTIFVRAVHKTKTTLTILGDGELSETLHTIQSKLGTDTVPAEMDQHVQKLHFRCQKTISVLNALAIEE